MHQLDETFNMNLGWTDRQFSIITRSIHNAILFPVDHVGRNDYIPRIGCRIGISVVKLAIISNLIFLSVEDLIGYVQNPWCYILPWTPAISTVQPGAVLVRLHTKLDAMGTALRRAGVSEYARIEIGLVDEEIVGRDAKLGTIIII
jgi:hypothetical protein